MAHMVEQMAYVGETPWHKLGRAMAAGAPVEQWITASGLNTTAEKRQLYYQDDNGNYQEVKAVMVRRQEDGQILCDHIGPDFELYQNVDAFKFFNPFIESGQASIETAGSLANGRRIFILARLNRDPLTITPNDPVNKYLLMANSHDGSLAIRPTFTPIRVVCQNTLTMANQDGASKFIRVFHTPNLHRNIEKIQEAINIADASFEGTAEQYQHLARRGISSADLRKYFKTVIGKDDAEELSTRSENIIEKMVSHYDAGREAMREVIAGYEIQQQAQVAGESALLETMLAGFETGRGTDDTRPSNGTYWQAYNAVTEYLTHDRGADSDKRLNSLWFGDSAKMNARALQTALTMSA